MDNISNGPVTPEEEARGEALPTRDECNLPYSASCCSSPD